MHYESPHAPEYFSPELAAKACDNPVWDGGRTQAITHRHRRNLLVVCVGVLALLVAAAGAYHKFQSWSGKTSDAPPDMPTNHYGGPENTTQAAAFLAPPLQVAPLQVPPPAQDPQEPTMPHHHEGTQKITQETTQPLPSGFTALSANPNTKFTDLILEYTVPAHTTTWKIITQDDIRGFLPKEDILITGYHFLGLSANGEPVLEHTSAYDGKGYELKNIPPTIELSYHHASIHTSMPLQWGIHANAIIFHGLGAVDEGVSYAPYGIRLRPRDQLRACVKVINRKAEAVTLFYHTKVAYEVLHQPESDARALVFSWLVTYPEEREIFNMTVMTDLRVVGFHLHGHAASKRWHLETYAEPPQVLIDRNMEHMTHGEMTFLPEPLHLKPGTTLRVVHEGERQVGTRLPFSVDVACQRMSGDDAAVQSPDELIIFTRVVEFQ